MKVVILAGGFGTRISEESHLKPKPMIEIGGRPILWHIMKCYSSYGFNDFIICAGYKQDYIKDYFCNYFLRCSDVTFDYSDNGKMAIHSTDTDPWRVTVVDTGLNTMTGGRIKRISKYVENETFMITYGDGVSDVHLDEVLKFHKNHGKIATLTAVHPDGRFGIMDLEGNNIKAFREKSTEDTGWVNGGFMVLDAVGFPQAETFEDEHVRHRRQDDAQHHAEEKHQPAGGTPPAGHGQRRGIHRLPDVDGHDGRETRGTHRRRDHRRCGHLHEPRRGRVREPVYLMQNGQADYMQGARHQSRHRRSGTAVFATV